MSGPAQKPLTFHELEAIEDRDGLRYESWDGQLVPMTGGTLAHNLIALGLQGVIKPQLEPPCFVTVADVGLRLNSSANSNKAYPDVMVVCDPDSGSHQTSPILVAEVLSDSSVQRDRVKKRTAYAEVDALQVYLILSQTALEVEVYCRKSGWQQQIYQGIDAVVELDVPAFRLPLADIYADALDLLGLKAP
jgi:Uma2 family endonuclease